MNKLEFKCVGDKIEINKDFCNKLYIDKRKDPIGMPPRKSIPKPFQCILGRFFHKKIILNCYDFSKPEESIIVSAPNGRHIVSCKLSEDQSLIVSLSSLFGWSSGIELKTRFSLQPATFALGKLFHVLVTGDGYLFFELNGSLMQHDYNASYGKSIDFSRMIAWETSSRFRVVGSSKLIDIYFSQLHLEQTYGDIVLLDSDDPSEGGGGLWKRFFSKFYIPK